MGSDDRADLWAGLRQEYADDGLTEVDLPADPVVMFERWLDDVVAAGLPEPNAMVVATADADGRPSARTVLLKGVSAAGFVFYTNLSSRKGRALAAEPRCALLFPWHPLQRQVRVEGTARLVSRDRVEEYFASRPRGSQVGAWASPQSEVVSGRDELDERYAAAETRLAGADVPPPGHWGGYLVRPEAVEFWQGRPGRMHDRLVFRRAVGDDWNVERLAP